MADISVHDDVLRAHQEKMAQHRKWMQEQQSAIRAISPRVGNAASPSPLDVQQYPGGVARGGGHQTVLSASSYQPEMSSQFVAAPSPYSAVSPTYPQHQGSGTPAGGSGRRTKPQQQTPHRSPQHKDYQQHDDENFVYVNTGSPLAVYMRGSQWLKRREQRLEEERQRKWDEECSECTFAPQHNAGEGRADSSSAARRGRGGQGAADSAHSDDSPHRAHPVEPVTDVAPGIAEHLDRLEKARQRVRDRSEKLNSVGANWTPEPTTPEPFQLGPRATTRHIAATSSIKSLRQPIQAPHRGALLDASAYRPFVEGSPDRSAAVPNSVEQIAPPGSFSQRISFVAPAASVVSKR